MSSFIQLGPVVLRDFEVPSSIQFGGRQKLAVHELQQGQRVVERLGPDEGDITFGGTISGADAEARVRQLDALRVSGQTIWLSWQSFRRNVILRSLRIDYRNPRWIPYRAVCTVVTPFTAVAVAATALQSVVTDLAMAASNGTDLPAVLGDLSAANVQSSVLIPGTAANIGALAAINSAALTTNDRISQQDNTIALQPDAAAAMTVTAAGDLAAAVMARAYIGRAAMNMKSGTQ